MIIIAIFIIFWIVVCIIAGLRLGQGTSDWVDNQSAERKERESRTDVKKSTNTEQCADCILEKIKEDWSMNDPYCPYRELNKLELIPSACSFRRGTE